MQLTADRIGSWEQGRAAVEHALNRKLNDRLSTRVAEGVCGMPWLLVCECGRPDCAETVEVSPAEYAAVRSCPHLYLVAPGHQSPGVTDVIVEVQPRFLMVELLPSAATAATRLGAGERRKPITHASRLNSLVSSNAYTEEGSQTWQQ